MINNISTRKVLDKMEIISIQNGSDFVRWSTLINWLASIEARRLTPNGAGKTTQKACKDESHDCYTILVDYKYCPICGERLSS